MARRSLIAIAVMAFFSVFAAPAAFADTEDIIAPMDETSGAGFQSGTCTANEEVGPPPVPCSVNTPNLWYTLAAGHPPIGYTQYIIEHEVKVPGVVEPIVKPIANRTIKTLRTDLPPGLTVNPEATPSRCSMSEFLSPGPSPGTIVPTCKPETIVGEDRVTLVTNRKDVEVKPGVIVPTEGFVIQPSAESGTKVTSYNLEPKPGEPARVGFVIGFKVPVILETEVAWENDWHESFTIKLPFTAEISGLSTLISRLISFGRSGDGTYLTNPTTCFDPNDPAYEHLYSTWFRAESHGEPNPTFPHGSTAVESKLPIDKTTGRRIMQVGCDTVPFEPSIEVNPGTNAVDSPAPATVTARLPFDPAKEGGDKQSQSHVRKAEVSLPKGMGLNPSGANGLLACTDAQFKKGIRTYANECPAASDIGSVEVDSPPLHEPLVGDVYVGEQKSTNPESGEMFRILIEAKSEKEGIDARLVGNLKADPVTGQLTAVLDDRLTGQFSGTLQGLPQVPFESVTMRLDGSKDVLTSPPTCAKQTTSSMFEPWARPGTFVSPAAEFTLTSDPSGGACPQTLGERKFAPGYSAQSERKKAGAYSPFRVRIDRPDGQQELKVVDVRLPKGLSAKLAGVPYCSEADIASAEKRSGKAERAESSCSSKSQIGTVSTVTGTGPNPLTIAGKAFLAGPYKGAPISMVTITPAVAGPFDLGNVVVRVALNVNPKNARVNAVSDVIPDVFGGVKLDIRSVDVNVDRKKFSLNPTSCRKQETSGVLRGGGADPANPAAFSSYAVKDPYKTKKCKKLGFKPKLFTKLSGPVQRAKNPRIRAVLEARNGDANIARTALTLPPSLFLDQSHIRTVCTRVQLAAQACPKAAIYGHARAKSPLLKKKLKGPVYLVSSDNPLPDLVADLRGQVNIQLHGVISSKGGGLKTVFGPVPDVPVRKFILNMRGGEKSLLVNSQNLCKSEQTAVLNIKGQNGKKVKDNRYRLNIAACGGKKNKKK
jgi:hypothetical protein